MSDIVHMGVDLGAKEGDYDARVLMRQREDGVIEVVAARITPTKKEPRANTPDAG